MRISDWSSDVCSSDLMIDHQVERQVVLRRNPFDVLPAAVTRIDLLVRQWRKAAVSIRRIRRQHVNAADAALAVRFEKLVKVGKIVADRKSTRLNSSH